MRRPSSTAITFPNTLTVTVDSGIFIDMLTSYAETLYNRQDALRSQLSSLPLGEPGVGQMFQSILDSWGDNTRRSDALRDLQTAASTKETTS